MALSQGAFCSTCVENARNSVCDARAGPLSSTRASHPGKTANSESAKRPTCTRGVAESVVAGLLKPSCLLHATERELIMLASKRCHLLKAAGCVPDHWLASIGHTHDTTKCFSLGHPLPMGNGTRIVRFHHQADFVLHEYHSHFAPNTDALYWVRMFRAL